MSLVSVVVPIYNEEQGLLRALGSIVDQTYENLELILVDDCSTDDTPRIIERFVREHGGRFAEVYAVRNDINLGNARTVNRGFSLASGEFLAMQDGDDASHPSRIATQYAMFQQHDDPMLGIVGCGFRQIDPDSRLERDVVPPAGHQDLLRLMPKKVMIPFGGLLLRTSMLNSIGFLNEKLSGCWEYDFYYRGLREGYRWIAAPEVLYDYYLHSASISRTVKPTLKRLLVAKYSYLCVRDMRLPIHLYRYSLAWLVYAFFPESLRRYCRRYLT